jgi:hypothetical protein
MHPLLLFKLPLLLHLHLHLMLLLLLCLPRALLLLAANVILSVRARIAAWSIVEIRTGRLVHIAPLTADLRSSPRVKGVGRENNRHCDLE